MNHLNSEHLRTFLAVCEAGSMTAGADRIHRSQAAASLQIKQLEDTVGQPLFRRHGRGVTLTPVGERLVPVARRVVRSLDSTLADLRGEGIAGQVRVGLPDDYGRTLLSGIVADFAALHPDVELDVQCAFGSGFPTSLENGTLDLAVYEVAAPQRGCDVLRRDDLVWMTARDGDLADRPVLPVALFHADCWWRDVALSSLEAVGRRYRVVFTSESVVGVRAAVASGMAAGLLSESVEGEELVRLPGLRFRQASFLVLQTGKGARGPACDAMRQAILRAFGV